MNKVILLGRMTKDAEVRRGDSDSIFARFNLAVDRRFKKEGDEQTADFISCVAFGKVSEFVEKFGHKGVKFVVEGRIQTGSYTNKDGVKIYTTDIVVENMEFAESKKMGESAPDGYADFMNIPEGMESEMPFK
ncbi:MAG: single-stranded DNA-binding protein [Neobacillus sp.]|jgi:single-strand DNA-binding protein|nr:single-stranded DNA-binding protein [Neobacillus sp.]